jgi:hypothetical protein
VEPWIQALARIIAVTNEPNLPLEQQLEEIRGQLDWARGYL